MVIRRTRSRDVLDILKQIGEWQAFVGPTGALLHRIPSSGGSADYTVSPASCTCPADLYRRRDRVCKHRQALALALMIQQAMNRPPQGGTRGLDPAPQPAKPATPESEPVRTG